jgi:hypothetical protein
VPKRKDLAIIGENLLEICQNCKKLAKRVSCEVTQT